LAGEFLAKAYAAQYFAHYPARQLIRSHGEENELIAALLLHLWR
jgi:hypothetical protein